MPTAREQGIDALAVLSYAGLLRTRNTPEPVLDRLEAACRTAMQGETFARAAAHWGLVPDFLGRRDFAARLAAEHAAHGKVLRELGVEPQ